MADLSGYTAMTDVHGGASAAMLVKKYLAMVDEALKGSTKVIQRVGDQIVLMAEHPTDVVETAKSINALIHEEHHFLSIHAGIHYGKVFVEKGNLFGSTVNIASRIMNVAEQGKILCSSDLVSKIDASQHAFKPIGNFSFKNVLSDVTVFELITELPQQHYIDPVCQMRIDPSKSKYIYQYKNKDYHFCSVRCRYIFRTKAFFLG